MLISVRVERVELDAAGRGRGIGGNGSGRGGRDAAEGRDMETCGRACMYNIVFADALLLVAQRKGFVRPSAVGPSHTGREYT